MKIHFNGFWNGFTENRHIQWFTNFFSKILKEDLVIGNINESNILVESLWKSESLIHTKKWKYTFLYSGEGHYLNWFGNRQNPLEEYSCILGFNKTYSNYVCFPYFVLYTNLNTYSFHPVKEVPINTVCAIVSNSTGSVRNIFLDSLEKKCKVAYGGSYKNNIGGKIANDSNDSSLMNFYRQFKFVICMENEQQDYYITEKIINGFRAGIIPIYWGSPNISKYFNPKRFLCLEKIEDADTIINKMLTMTDSEYLEIIHEPIFLKNDYLSEVIDDTIQCLHNTIPWADKSSTDSHEMVSPCQE